MVNRKKISKFEANRTRFEFLDGCIKLKKITSKCCPAKSLYILLIGAEIKSFAKFHRDPTRFVKFENDVIDDVMGVAQGLHSLKMILWSIER